MKWFTSAFTVDHILDQYVAANVAGRELWGFVVQSSDEIFRCFDEHQVVSFLQAGKTARDGKAVLHVLIYRYPLSVPGFPEQVFRTEVFYVTYDKRYVYMLKDCITGRAMSGLELANTLLALHAQVPLWKTVENCRPRHALFLKDDYFSPIPREVYRRLFREFLNRHGRFPRVFVGSLYTGVKKDFMRELFTSSAEPLRFWQGLVWITVVFNDATPFLLEKASGQKAWTKRYITWKKILEQYKEGELNIVPVCVHFISFDEKVDEYVDALFERLGFQPVERTVDGSDVYLSWFKTFDFTAAYFLEAKDVTCYLIKSFCKTTIVGDRIKKRPDLVGTSKAGNIVFYSFWGENPAQHSLIVAPTGSGKTFFLLNMLSELLGVNVAGLLSGTSEKKPFPYKVRFLDVGLTGEFFARLMQKRGYDVSAIRPKLSSVRINPFEVWEEDDIDFVVGAVKLILGAGVGDKSDRLATLNVAEETILRRCMMEVLERRADVVELPTLKELREEAPELATKVQNEFSLDEYDKVPFEAVKGTPFEHPRVSDVIAIVNARKNAPGVTQTDREAAESLISKLKYIESVANFASATAFNVKSSDFLYLDLLHLKASSIFVPLVGLLLRKLIKEDSMFGEDLKLYIVEEAHNLFRHEAFADLFNVLTREARKHRIYLCYITQGLSDIPDVVLQGIHTKFILKSGKDVEFIQEVSERMNFTEEEKRLLVELPKYTPLVKYSGGVFTMVLPVDDAKTIVFDSTRVTLSTIDGIILRRGEWEPKSG